MSGFTFNEFRDLRDRLKDLEGRISEINLDVAKKLGELIKRKVKLASPVDSGDLRDNWKVDVYKEGNAYKIHVHNKMDYASYVEYGHRIVAKVPGGDAYRTVGWQEGVFMLRYTIDDVDEIALKYWQDHFEKELTRIV